MDETLGWFDETGRVRPDADEALAQLVDELERRQGFTLYPAQVEAFLEIAAGSNVIMATPTGTGKSLVALAAHVLNPIVNPGTRTYYTAPIKALVSEKFFALNAELGSKNVGMVTGDSSINPDAPVICCTAEILANVALRLGENASIGTVVMDEFHYYADPERGWAWQVPLLELPHAQFVLMSATLGDVSALADDIERRTGRSVATIAGTERPVPLEFSYVQTPIHETIDTLLLDKKAPVYVVHFSQADAVERAQALSSLKLISREQRDEIAEAIGDFRFLTGFGQTLSRLVRSGIGVHHAGMLPRYRRLVEQLAQRGLLKVICGTDTLGVGINVPIRTVLLTSLSKFDGERVRHLNAREFHQIAGRAGRAGFDTEGDVVLQAPEHEIENVRLTKRAGDDPKKVKKIVRKQAPAGFVSWGEASFNKLVAAQPEPLRGHMQMTSAMLINVIARGGDVLGNVRRLVFDNHQSRPEQFSLARRAIQIYRSLRDAGLVTNEPSSEPGVASAIRLTVDLPPHFALNQPLSAFAIAAIELLDPDSPTFSLDVISIVEATLDDPRAVLAAQRNNARRDAVSEMKAAGIEYEERMARLELVTYPKPLEELLNEAFAEYVSHVPWAADFEVRPKSVVRDMIEGAHDFRSYVGHYGLNRSEGTVLRYLSDAYRTIRQTVVAGHDSELADYIAWLGAIVRGTDSSLVDEWSELVAGGGSEDESLPGSPDGPAIAQSVVDDVRAFTIMVRNELFRRVQFAAFEKVDALGELDSHSGWNARKWGEALDGYFTEYDYLGAGAEARSAALVAIDRKSVPGIWLVRQTFDDPSGDHDWGISAEVDLQLSAEAGAAVVRVVDVGPVKA